jgi:flagellar basal-body rod modification protein FlgD
MNAYMLYRANHTGALSPTPAERVKAAKEVTALARANILGRLGRPHEAVKSSAGTGAGTDLSSQRVAGSTLGRDEFLLLLVEEMRNQDPMTPMDNTEMIAQLAQFSALEQMTALNDTVDGLADELSQISTTSAGALLGRYIAGVDIEGNPVEGVVSAIQFDRDAAYLHVGEQTVPLAGVVAIGENPSD